MSAADQTWFNQLLAQAAEADQAAATARQAGNTQRADRLTQAAAHYRTAADLLA